MQSTADYRECLVVHRAARAVRQNFVALAGAFTLSLKTLALLFRPVLERSTKATFCAPQFIAGNFSLTCLFLGSSIRGISGCTHSPCPGVLSCGITTRRGSGSHRLIALGKIPNSLVRPRLSPNPGCHMFFAEPISHAGISASRTFLRSKLRTIQSIHASSG